MRSSLAPDRARLFRAKHGDCTPPSRRKVSRMPACVVERESEMKFLFAGIASIACMACTHELSQSSAGGNVEIAPEMRPAGTSVTLVSAPAATKAYRDTTLGADARVSMLEAEVAVLNARVANGRPTTIPDPLDRDEVELTPDTFSDISDFRWAELIRYSDGGELKRLRMRPVAGHREAEEFFYDRGHLIAVHYHSDGEAREDPHSLTTGQMFYFGQEGMLAWVREGGTRGDPSSAEFKRWADLLLKEGERFPLVK
jgi:hypothetical protein